MSIWIGKDTDNNVRAQLNSQPELDHLGLTWEEVTEYVNPDSKHVLRKLVVPSLYTKELTAINYLTELKSGVRLDAEVTITKDGLVSETIYCYEENEVKKPVIKVKETYEYWASDMGLNPAERGMFSQEKKWQYYLEDGTLDESERNTKIKSKIYKTNRQILEVGGKRRSNIVGILSEKVGAILVILGVFVGDETTSAKKKAYDTLRNLSSAYSADFTEYKSYATTNLYNSINNDSSFTWLNIHVPTHGEFIASGRAQAEADIYQGHIDALELKDMQGLRIRDYFIEKLKGNVS